MTGETWQQAADRLAAQRVREGAPTAWFEDLYSAARRGEVDTPWDRTDPHPVLAAWAGERALRGDGRSAVVVGAGLGADAAFVTGLGYQTTAFDVSPTAVEEASSRLAAAGCSEVSLEVADLLRLPTRWHRRFDLVVEVFTVQAMPRGVRELALTGVASLVAPGGTLLAVQAVRPDDDDGSGPPWLLTTEEMGGFARDGLSLVALDLVGGGGWPLHRAELRRPRRAG